MTPGASLHSSRAFVSRYFPHLSGQAPELDNPSHLFALGDLVGSYMRWAQRRSFAHRRQLDVTAWSRRAREQVLACRLAGAAISVRPTERISAALGEQLKPERLRRVTDPRDSR